jgi:hypothetical protein
MFPTKLICWFAAAALVAESGCRGAGETYDSTAGPSESPSYQASAASPAVQPVYAVSDVPRANSHSRVFPLPAGPSGCPSCRTSGASPAVQPVYAISDDPRANRNLGVTPLPRTNSSPARIQRICPVTGAQLGSMGAPVPVAIGDNTVYVCCAGCRDKVMHDPETHLARVDAELRGAQ